LLRAIKIKNFISIPTQQLQIFALKKIPRFRIDDSELLAGKGDKAGFLQRQAVICSRIEIRATAVKVNLAPSAHEVGFLAAHESGPAKADHIG